MLKTESISLVAKISVQPKNILRGVGKVIVCICRSINEETFKKTISEIVKNKIAQNSKIHPTEKEEAKIIKDVWKKLNNQPNCNSCYKELLALAEAEITKQIAVATEESSTPPTTHTRTLRFFGFKLVG